jgi:CHASE3 domain sensor protein
VATWGLAIAAFAIASTYAVGGRDVFRQMIRRGREVRSQATAALQPPTQAEIQRAAQDAAATASRTETGVSPISLAHIAVWVGCILIIIVAMFYLTGRAQPKRRD